MRRRNTSSVGDVAVTNVIQAVEDEEAGHVLLLNRIAAHFETKDPLGPPQIHLDVLLPTATGTRLRVTLIKFSMTINQ